MKKINDKKKFGVKELNQAEGFAQSCFNSSGASDLDRKNIDDRTPKR